MRELGARTQSRSLEARPKAKTVEERGSLTCLLWLAQPGFCFFYTTQDHLPSGGGGGTTHNGVSLPMSIINQENVSTHFPTGRYGGIFSVEAPPSQMALACVKTT